MSARSLRHLHMATDNAAAFWTALGTTRNHRVIRKESFLAVLSGTRIGNRILLLSPTPSPDAVRAIRDLVASDASVPTVVEDPFSTIGSPGIALASRPMPVMARMPRVTELDSKWTVRTVRSLDDLRTAEHVIVHGFPLTRAQPYAAGEVLPDALLAYPGFEAFLIGDGDSVVGACVTMTAAAAAGAYWVTTLPAHRSQGVARALMVAAMNHHSLLPMTLDASEAGKPLYDSLGFEVVAESTWWT